MRLRSTTALCACLMTGHAASAACDLPALGPTELLAIPGGGAVVHVVTGTAAVCDPTARSFDVDLPDLHAIRAVRVQVSLAGFSRHYGVHQIGFALQSLAAMPSRTGVTVKYGAAVDGLDRYQLAYTLSITTDP